MSYYPEAPRNVKFLVVVFDYFTKWRYAEPLASVYGRGMIKFTWKNILIHFGTPKTLISDNGLQFSDNGARSTTYDNGSPLWLIPKPTGK